MIDRTFQHSSQRHVLKRLFADRNDIKEEEDKEEEEGLGEITTQAQCERYSKILPGQQRHSVDILLMLNYI